MLEKDKLRRADIFSGGLICCFGLWVISQALQMPMKDSWGGVQNVWYVSPALFPLLVGTVIALLGGLLIRTALKTVGLGQLRQVLNWLCSNKLIKFMWSVPIFRFYATVVLFFSFVYLNIPRIDFFLSSILFLAAFISMFYFDDDILLKKMLFFYCGGSLFFVAYFISGLETVMETFLPYPSDWMALVFIVFYCLYCLSLTRENPELGKKYRTALILSLTTPFLICPIFKYFLMVPMPKEGLVVALLDAVWYLEF